MKIGNIVRMTHEFKQRMIGTESEDHIREFGDCIGKVVGPMFPGTSCPEVDVQWWTDDEGYSLRYGYHPNDLDIRVREI